MATQEEVLQKVNEHCTEKQYTLNDDFRSKFSEKFATNNADADVNDENILNSIKFNIDTAFSAASKELKVKGETWKTKEAEYQKQIETLKKGQQDNQPKPTITEPKIELPDDIKKELEELKQFKEKNQEQEKRAEVLKIAQKNVREDLHEKLEEILNLMQLDYSKNEKELAEQLNANFTKFYKGIIGDTRPSTPEINKIKDEDLISRVKKIQIK